MAKINLVYGEAGNHSSKYTFFFVFPWQLLIVIFVVLAVILFIGKILINKYNSYIIKKAREGMTNIRDANHG
jgi:hypothetical protein